jgi:pentalenene oxygenase
MVGLDDVGCSIPWAPRAHPVIGHTLALSRDPWAFLTSLSALGSGLVRVRLGLWTVVVVCDADLTHQVLRNDRIFDKGGPLFDVARMVVGDNVITAPHDRHRRQRRLIQPAFHQGRLAGYATAMAAETDAVTRRWADGAVIDVLAEMLQITTGTFLAVMFSQRLTSDVLGQALADVTTIVKGLYRQMLAPAIFARRLADRGTRYGRARGRLRALINDIVAQHRNPGVDAGDLVSSLVAAEDAEALDPDHRSFTDAEIFDQLTAFLIAGSETTASALSWSLYLLSRHPDVLARLQAESDEVLTDGTARYEQLSQLPITQRILTEALRLYPPGWLFTRRVTADTELCGYRLKRGTAILYSPYLLHRLDRHFEDPQRFDPDRWLIQTPSDPHGSFVPFGAGARRCAGEHFARTEAVLALATIAHRWHLHAVTDRPVRPALAAGLRPRRFHLRVTARSQHHNDAHGRAPI